MRCESSNLLRFFLRVLIPSISPTTYWWPHGSLLIANGTNMKGLLVIEYVFHVMLMVVGAILATFFLALLRQRAAWSP